MSSREEILGKLKDSIVSLDIEGCRNTAMAAVEKGIPPYEAVIEGMAKGMEVVGEKYKNGEYFLPELVMAGNAMKAGLEILEPLIDKAVGVQAHKVLFGTVEGDLHDIGKNIVIAMLRSAGFKVKDLGIDVPAQVFVEQVRMYQPMIVAMSALLTTTMVEMGNVIKALETAGLRDRLKIMVGGRPVAEDFASEIGADGYGHDALEALTIAKKLVGMG